MTIRHGCFFSYAHGKHEHMRKFKDDLVEAMKCYLEPHFDNENELFVDSEQLGGGDDLDGKIARALCESVCMIVIYTPKYEAHAYSRHHDAPPFELAATNHHAGHVRRFLQLHAG
jgi:hypothetical protein